MDAITLESVRPLYVGARRESEELRQLAARLRTEASEADAKADALDAAVAAFVQLYPELESSERTPRSPNLIRIEPVARENRGEESIGPLVVRHDAREEARAKGSTLSACLAVLAESRHEWMTVRAIHQAVMRRRLAPSDLGEPAIRVSLRRAAARGLASKRFADGRSTLYQITSLGIETWRHNQPGLIELSDLDDSETDSRTARAVPSTWTPATPRTT